ncbi:MAG: hypothetical protein G01um101416_811 [Microgenomates group bacterium Gr01-1014_16]|nr:MAG: hypothetical protein G01um101416_811 [Microgenomates group bacterium Gr01-1014_16]
MKKMELRLPTILGLLVVGVGLGAGLILVKNPLRLQSFASEEEIPAEVKVSNVTDSSFTVSWITGKTVSGFVQYGEGEGSLELVMSDDRDQEKGEVGGYYTHYVTLRGLAENKEYFYKIGSGKELFGDEDKPYEITTGPGLENTPVADVSYGQIVDKENNPVEGAIIYLNLPGSDTASAISKNNGAWVIPVATVRTEDLSSFVTYDKAVTEVEIFAQGGEAGVSNVSTTTANDSPVATIELGKDYERSVNAEPVPTGAVADTGTKFSGESLAPGADSGGGGSLEILTPKQNEKLNTFRPEIVGRAPAGALVEIEINSSSPVVGKVKAGDDGTFNFSVPVDLEPGAHTLTISTTISGVLKKITKSFTVYAQGESNLPAFEATPSATLVPSPIPSTTLVPTAVPTLTVSPTATPTTMPTTTPEPPTELPTVGNVWPTILILVFGLGLLASGGFLLKSVR